MATMFEQHETQESQALYARALEKIANKDMESAIEDLEAALSISPDHAEYLSLYGLSLAVVYEDYISALRLCRRALGIDPNTPGHFVNLGKVHQLRGDKARAHQVFSTARKADKDDSSAATELSRMGLRRPPVLRRLRRSHWINIQLGKFRARLEQRRQRSEPTLTPCDPNPVDAHAQST